MDHKLPKPISILIAFILTANLLYSQSNTLYFMDMVHQTNYLNPAYQNSCNGFWGLPALSGVFVEGANSAFDYNDLLHNGEGIRLDSLIIDINKVKAQLSTTNYFLAGTQVPIFGLGFWVKNAYFTFDVSNKTRIRLSYPADLIKLIDGNANYIGENNPITMENIGPSAINYNEISFGLSKKILHRLTIGGKFKILSGNLNVQSPGSSVKLYTAEAEDNYAMRLETDLKINMAGPFSYEFDDQGNISNINPDSVFKVSQILSAKNLGMAIDFGAIYQLNDKFRLYGSVTDLGFINWKGNAKSLTQKGTFEFSGLALDSVFSESDYNELEQLADSLADFINFSEAASKYTNMLNTNIYLGATYDIGNFMNIGILSRTYFFDNGVHESATFSANFKPIKWFGASLSYSYMNKEYRNIGLGMAVRLGGFQLYFISDNVNVAFNPKEAKSVRAQIGLNIYFGCGKRDNFSMMKNKTPKKDTDFMY